MFIFISSGHRDCKVNPACSNVGWACEWDLHIHIDLTRIHYSYNVRSRWFCHVDDDNYVILPSLLQLLSSYHHSQDVYLGRPSLDHPIEAAERVKSDGSVSLLHLSMQTKAP